MKPGVVAAATLLLASCAVHAPTPSAAPSDATGGHAPVGFDAKRACGDWDDSLGPGGSAAATHVSYPELDPSRSCFVPVHYESGSPRPDPTPAGCGYPQPYALSTTIDLITLRAEKYEKIAQELASTPPERLPIDLACSLPNDVRRSAARANARTARALADRIEHLGTHPPYPYSAVSTFGYGFSAQSKSALVPYRPGDKCPELSDGETFFIDSNYLRAARAAEAYRAGVAPVVTVSGGAIHSRLTEAFLLYYLVTCRFGVPDDAVLVDPCADHTHTNVRNTGSFVVAIGGRTAYIVTDDWLQSKYLEEWTAFDLMFGSIDQRSLRDFGYLLGSFRRASVGMPAGFWYTPYRFWAEPVEGLGSFTCVP
ncbi:MAG: YdcF family protein [Polyangiaceae bacterium]